jgi:predicted dehydrogenase
MWLGPAPWRPYNAGYVNGDWRRYWDFDSGAALLDWGAHTVDLCQWANQADDTMPVEYVPSDTNITCRYENGMTLVLDFLKTPFGDRGPNWITRLGTCPVRFVGSEGSVETGDNGEMVIKLVGMPAEAVRPDQGISGLDVALHARNFFDSIKSRKPPVCNSSVMRHSHIACHAAALSWILGRTLKFDPRKEQFVNDHEANGLLTRPARTYWAE